MLSKKKINKSALFQRQLPTTKNEESENTIANVSNLKTGTETIDTITLSQNYLNVYNDNIIYGKLNLGLDASIIFSNGSEQTIAYTDAKDTLLFEHENKITQLFGNDRNFTDYNILNNQYKTDNTIFTNQNRQRIIDLENLNIAQNFIDVNNTITNLNGNDILYDANNSITQKINNVVNDLNAIDLTPYQLSLTESNKLSSNLVQLGSETLTSYKNNNNAAIETINNSITQTNDRITNLNVGQYQLIINANNKLSGDVVLYDSNTSINTKLNLTNSRIDGINLNPYQLSLTESNKLSSNLVQLGSETLTEFKNNLMNNTIDTINDEIDATNLRIDNLNLSQYEPVINENNKIDGSNVIYNETYNIKEKIDNVQSLIPNYDLSGFETKFSASNKLSSDFIQMSGNQNLTQYKSAIAQTLSDVDNSLNQKQSNLNSNNLLNSSYVSYNDDTLKNKLDNAFSRLGTVENFNSNISNLDVLKDIDFNNISDLVQSKMNVIDGNNKLNANFVQTTYSVNNENLNDALTQIKNNVQSLDNNKSNLSFVNTQLNLKQNTINSSNLINGSFVSNDGILLSEYIASNNSDISDLQNNKSNISYVDDAISSLNNTKQKDI